MAKIAMPVARDFEDSELTVPLDGLRNAGHDVIVVGPKAGEVAVGKRGQASVTVDRAARDVSASDFDALVIPGGYSPDHLRTDADVVALVRDIFASGKPVAAICHGPQLLIEADAVSGRRLTSWPSVRKDLENAGARWEDHEVVVDGNLITSRKPEDLEAFTRAVLKALPGARAAGAGAHAG
jgi:protease I